MDSLQEDYIFRILTCLEQELIQSFLLISWDNILGPKVQCIWHGKDQKSSCLDLENLKYIAAQNLNGEIFRIFSPTTIDSKFFVVKDENYMCLSLIFPIINNGIQIVHSFSTLMPSTKLRMFLDMHEFMESWLKTIVCQMKEFLRLEKTRDNAFERCDELLIQFLEVLSSLKIGRLPTPIKISDTFLTNKDLIDQEFLKSIISSHLQTFSSSVVIGDSIQDVNKMILTLALFLSPQEQNCSRLLVSQKNWQYHPHLHLQGLIKDSYGRINISSKDMLSNKYPITFVDMNLKVLRQSFVHNQYMTEEHHMLPFFTINSKILHSVEHSETLVTNFLNEFYRLACTPGVKELFISHFRRYLNYKAFTLIKYIEAEKEQGKEFPYINSLLKLKYFFDLTQDGDFYIILAFAEKLRQGTYFLFNVLDN